MLKSDYPTPQSNYPAPKSNHPALQKQLPRAEKQLPRAQKQLPRARNAIRPLQEQNHAPCKQNRIEANQPPREITLRRCTSPHACIFKLHCQKRPKV